MTYAHPMLDEGITHQLLPRWAKLIILFDLAIIVFGLTSLSQRYRHLGFALTAAITLPLLYALMNLTQHWMALSSPLAIVLTGWLMTFTKNYKTPTIPEQTINAHSGD
jgi:CHASE2 domain-containing sensor protein